MSRRSKRLRREKAAQAEAALVRLEGPANTDCEIGTNLDGWENFATKMGNAKRDKRLSAVFCEPPYMFGPELEDIYHGNDLANRICTLPAQEATRAWVELKIDDDGTDQVARQDTVKSVEQSMQTLGVQARVAEAITWARLFGGSIIYVGADTGSTDDPTLPLDLERVQSIRFLTVFHRFEVMITDWDQDPLSPTYGQPLYYRPIRLITPQGSAQELANQYTKIHASRVIHFDGTKCTRLRRRRNQGWSDSVIVKLYEVLRGYGVTWDSAEALMQDFAQAVLKIKGLADMMAANGEDAVKARIELMDYARSVIGTMLLDAEHEDFERKPTPLTGLPELIDRWLYRVSSATGIPITLLFGMSPGGMNATGESDVRFFYDSIRTYQENELRPGLEKLFKIILCAKDGPTAGAEPPGWSFCFVPLWQLSDPEKASMRKTVAETDALYLDRDVISASEIAQSRFGGDDYSQDTSLDTEARQLMSNAEAYVAPDGTPQGAAQAPGAAPAPMGAGKPPADGSKQVAAMLEIVKAVAAEEIPRDAGVAMLVIAFQLAPAAAESIMGDAGKGFTATPPPASVAGPKSLSFKRNDAGEIIAATTEEK